jgi:hypothetical protein
MCFKYNGMYSTNKLMLLYLILMNLMVVNTIQMQLEINTVIPM